MRLRSPIPLSILPLALWAISAPAAASDCGPGRPEIVVELSLPPETLEHRLDSAALASLNPGSFLPGYTTQGLTKVDYQASYRIEFVSERLPDGRWCSRVGRLAVEFGFTEPPTVFVSSSVPRGGCLYREVLAHEYRHLAIAKETVSAAGSMLRDRLVRLLAGNGVRGNDPDSANAVIDDAVSRAVDDVSSGLYRAAAARNAALDTPSEYALLGKACPGS